MLEHICCWTGSNLRVEQKPPGLSTSVAPYWAQMFRVKEQLWKENQTTGSGSLDSFRRQEKWTRTDWQLPEANRLHLSLFSSDRTPDLEKKRGVSVHEECFDLRFVIIFLFFTFHGCAESKNWEKKAGTQAEDALTLFLRCLKWNQHEIWRAWIKYWTLWIIGHNSWVWSRVVYKWLCRHFQWRVN